ncbi:MAG TPA: metal ABC transporter permease [Limnochordales bacterium]
MSAAGALEAAWLWLRQPFDYGFMRSALLAALLVGGVGGLASTFTVVRGTAFFADALAHAVLPGVAAAYLLAGPGGGALFWGGLAAALAASAAIHAVAREGHVREETAIGVVMAASLALGVALISTRRAYAVDLAHVLFGDVLGVGPEDLARAAALGALTVAVVLLLWRPLAIVSFDPVLAGTMRLPVGWLQLGLLVLVALTTVLALQTVGATMTLALLVTPGAAARLVARSLAGMAAISVALAVAGSVVGLYLSYYLSIPSGPAIVLALTAGFALVRAAARR